MRVVQYIASRKAVKSRIKASFVALARFLRRRISKFVNHPCDLKQQFPHSALLRIHAERTAH
jgi:hypothetical protein